jgi:Ca2+-binding EF-hand superfamily protein
MQLTRTIFLGAALAVSFGAAQAAGDKQGDVPGFNELDRNDDGALTRSEAAANPALAARFKEVDSDGDGKVSRFEYLKTMAKKDFNSLREKAADFIEPNDKASAGDTKPGR